MVDRASTNPRRAPSASRGKVGAKADAVRVEGRVTVDRLAARIADAKGAAQKDRAAAAERLTRVERTRRDGISDTEGDGVHSDSPPVVLDGQRAGDQSPSGSVVCPTSIR